MIEAEISGHIGQITLNRPEAHNALTRAAMQAIMAQLEDPFST